MMKPWVWGENGWITGSQTKQRYPTSFDERGKMQKPSKPIDVYLEIGSKKVFAGAVNWPGWCRSGSDESSALQALLNYAGRYARALEGKKLGFEPPSDITQLNVIEHLTGTKTTDFGAPDAAPQNDSLPLDTADLQRSQVLLEACWQTFDSAVSAASGRELRKGPRGGGRDLDRVIQHVLNAEAAYLRSMARKHKVDEAGDLMEEMDKLRKAVLEALATAQRGELPERGPRGGVTWKPRYFVRRAAWHVLDHAWELEDRLIE
jgi:hypothetical protein